MQNDTHWLTTSLHKEKPQPSAFSFFSHSNAIVEDGLQTVPCSDLLWFLYKLPTIETMQSVMAESISRKDSHNRTLPVAKTLEPPWLPNSIVELNNSTAMATVSAMTAARTTLSPGPEVTMESAAAKQKMSKKTLPHVKYIRTKPCGRLHAQYLGTLNAMFEKHNHGTWSTSVHLRFANLHYSVNNRGPCR